MPEEIGKYSHLQKRESESGNQWSSDNGATAWEKLLCEEKNQNVELIYKTQLEFDSNRLPKVDHCGQGSTTKPSSRKEKETNSVETK